MSRTVVDSVPLLRWVFQQKRRVVTCAVDVAGDGRSFDVSLVPHWNLSDTTIESFRTAASALARHAEIALKLRQGGWAVDRQMPVATRTAD
jgi:hypothetical protein